MATIHEFGPYRLDAATEMLFRQSEPVVLGRRAVTLLRLLVERAGTPVSKDALMEAAWPGLAIEESNLTVQIAALRRIFADVEGARPGSRRCRAAATVISGRRFLPGPERTYPAHWHLRCPTSRRSQCFHCRM